MVKSLINVTAYVIQVLVRSVWCSGQESPHRPNQDLNYICCHSYQPLDFNITTAVLYFIIIIIIIIIIILRRI